MIIALTFLIHYNDNSTYLRRKRNWGYGLAKSQENINQLLYIDDMKGYSKKEEEREILILTLRIYSQNIGMESDIEICVILIMKREKNEDGRIELPNWKSIRTLWENKN